MARKRKTKKKRSKEGQAEAVEATGSAPDTEGGGGAKAPPKKSKKKGGKQGKTKKKPAKKRPSKAESSTPTSDEENPEKATADDEPPVEDVAVIEDVDEAEDLEELIAATVAGGQPREEPAALPATSLDEEPTAKAESVDAETPVETSENESSDAVPPGDAAATATEPEERREHEAGDAPVEPPEAAEAHSAEASAEPEEEGPDSEADLEGAVDLGPESTPELRDRLLAQALAHAELQEARYRVPYSTDRSVARWKGGMAFLILLAATIVAVVPPAWVLPDPPARITPSARVEGIRSALLLQAQQVDAFRARQQRLPTALSELPERLPGIRYVRSGNRTYQLVAYGPEGNAILYDSTDPTPEFERVVPGWSVGETR